MEFSITPTSKQLLAVIALLSRENDSLRERVSSVRVNFFERTFSRDDLEIGLSLAPTAAVSASGTVMVKLES